MKLKCPLSGLSYEASFFSGETGFACAPHPIFASDSNKLIGSHLAQLTSLEAKPQELHLFGTFLISKLPIEAWGFPLLEQADLETYWVPFWLQHIQQLSSTVLRLSGKTPKNLPTFRLIESYKDEGFKPLGNLKEWLTVANAAIDEYYAPITALAQARNKVFRANLGETQFTSEDQCKEVIEKALKGSLLTKREKEKFPSLIADWAAKVGNFPNTVFKDESGKKHTIRDHWKRIITSAFEASADSYSNIIVSGVTIGDLEELVEHCSINIPSGTIHSKALFDSLDAVKGLILEFRSPAKTADLAIEILTSGDIASILGEVSSVAPALHNKENDDPNFPQRADYPSLSSYLKAKVAYKKEA